MPLLVLVVIVSAAICFGIAKWRRARHFYWTAMGILLGPFALPFVFFAAPAVAAEPACKGARELSGD